MSAAGPSQGRLHERGEAQARSARPRVLVAADTRLLRFARPYKEAARNFYRPIDAAVAAKYASQFAKVSLFNLSDYFGDWQKAQKAHFADGGSFDQIYRPGP